MLNKKIYTLAFLLLLSCNTVTAQFYLTGEAPWRVRWNQIKSENYTVIYPQGIDSLAQRYTWLLESERERVMAGVIADPNAPGPDEAMINDEFTYIVAAAKDFTEENFV